jgi:hypothetical protein
MPINSPTVRSDPPIWIRRLVLLRQCHPPEVIREVTFRRGLNIILGEGVGHAVGKSTLCRLIRACLGESDLFEPGRRADIEREFPGGAIAADVVVDGTTWNVVRPFASNARGRAALDLDLLELAQDPPSDHPWHAFQDAIHAATLGRLDPPVQYSDGTPAAWPHLLAACTRDQSTRLSDVLTWRPAKVPSRKEDRSLLYRTLLGLLDAKEAAAAREVIQAETHLSEVKGRLTRLEHDARVRFLDHWQVLASDPAFDRDAEAAWEANDLGDEILQVVVNRLRQEHEAMLRQASAHIDAALDQRSRASLALEDLQRQIDELNCQVENLTLCARGDPDARKAQVAAIDQMLAAGATCQHLQALPYTFPLSKCNELTSRLEAKRADYNATGAWDEATNHRNQTQINELQAQVRAVQTLMEQPTADRNRAHSELAMFSHQQREAQRTLDRNDESFQRITASLAIRSGNDDESSSLRADQSTCEHRLEQAKAQRDACMAESSQATSDVRALYRELVKAIAGPAYWGKAELTAKGIEFEMGTDTAAGGETYKALAVPIADLTALLRGIAGQGIHPGFLIHDCPREADMNAALYGHLFEAAKSLEDQHGGPDHAAFQYIITTTTPPPDNLSSEPWIRERFSSDSADGLLFKTRISTPIQMKMQIRNESDSQDYS